jgi:glutamate carboxypeptidase
VSSALDYLKPIDEQAEELVALTAEWAAVPSGSLHLAGLETLCHRIGDAFTPLGGELRRVELPVREFVDPLGKTIQAPVAPALTLRKRPEAPRRVLLVGHMDTVFGAELPQPVLRAAPGVLYGPGVLDAKGGLVVMRAALAAVEASPWAEGIGWEVWISSDEEVGSAGSRIPLAEAARRNHLGLVFEPALPGGALVGGRKGSGQFAVVIRGRAAHAGRNPDEGRNAIHTLAEFIVGLKSVVGGGDGIRVNVGRIAGGGAVNVVPDLALCWADIRVAAPRDQEAFEEHLRLLASDVAAREGFQLELHGGFGRPPKVMDEPALRVYGALHSCALELGRSLEWRPSGGGSDGNLLSAAGLPTADGLGPEGQGMHTAQEHLLVSSLASQAKLVALFLMRLGAGDVLGDLPPGGQHR